VLGPSHEEDDQKNESGFAPWFGGEAAFLSFCA
jgi:hypothetical protein